MKKQSLSDKIKQETIVDVSGFCPDIIREELKVKDVKEAVKELKDKICSCYGTVTCINCQKCNKIFGDKLT